MRCDAARDAALAAVSRGEMGAIELRRRLGGATFGEVADLPRSPTQASPQPDWT